MSNNWIITANASKALVCVTDSKHSISVLETLTHGESSLKNHDLVTDSAGNHTSGTASQGHETTAEPKKKEAERFAKIVAAYIERAHLEKKFNKLTIASSPEFLGELKTEFSKELSMAEFDYINKDFTKLTTEDLLKAVLKEESA